MSLQIQTCVSQPGCSMNVTLFRLQDRVIFHLLQHTRARAPHSLPGFVERFRAFLLCLLALLARCGCQGRLRMHIIA